MGEGRGEGSGVVHAVDSFSNWDEEVIEDRWLTSGICVGARRYICGAAGGGGGVGLSGQEAQDSLSHPAGVRRLDPGIHARPAAGGAEPGVYLPVLPSAVIVSGGAVHLL